VRRAALGAAAVLLAYRLPDIAGLFRDEATTGLLASQIVRGARPLRGFYTDYTAPLFYYVVAASFKLFGESVAALRAPGVLLNLAAAALYADFWRRRRPKESTEAAALLATLPAFVVFSRLATENCALNPFFLVAGVWCFEALSGVAGAILLGALWTLGAWNHGAFVPGAAAIAAVYLWNSRERKRLGWAVAGASVAAIPWAASFFAPGRAVAPGLMTDQPRFPPSAALLNLSSTIGGEGLYARACGEVLVRLGWLFAVAALFLAVRALKFDRDAERRRWLTGLCAAFALGAAGTWLVAPGPIFGARVWLLPLWLIPAMVALAAASLPGKWGRGVVLALCALNLSSLAIDYFYAYSRTGGLAKAEVDAGGKLDNSVDFVDMRPVLRAVDDGGSSPVYIQDFNLHRALFLGSPGLRARLRLMPPANGPQPSFPEGSLLAFSRLDHGGAPEPAISLGDKTARYRADLSGENFLVYEAARAPVKRKS
jgi:4-amino-4-deoxy-L-arabinose transferase-like glycosyltransferase